MVTRSFLSPGGSVSAHAVQSSVSQRLAADTRSRRRSLPPSLSVLLSQSVNQRWRERPRCPAPRVTRGYRDGVVHAIVGRVARRCLRAVNVQDERAAGVDVFVSRLAGECGRQTEQKSVRARRCVPGRNVTFANGDPGIAPSLLPCWRRARRRQRSSLRFDPADGRAFGH
jgi:hypothetical protein